MRGALRLFLLGLAIMLASTPAGIIVGAELDSPMTIVFLPMAIVALGFTVIAKSTS